MNEDEKVSTVKELVSERLNIPANQQRLLYKGKALAGKLLLSHFPLPLCMIAIGLATNSFCNRGDLYRYIDCILYCLFQMSTDWAITLLDRRLNWIWSFVLWAKGVERQEWLLAAAAAAAAATHRRGCGKVCLQSSQDTSVQQMQQKSMNSSSRYLIPSSSNHVACLAQLLSVLWTCIFIKLLVRLVGCWLVYFIVQTN